MSFTFRRAGPDDAEIVRTLTREAYARWVPLIGREPLPMVADYDAAVRNHLIELAYSADDLSGLIEIIPHADHILIENVAVSPAMQGRGLGKLLVARAEDIARERGTPMVKLYTNAKFESNIKLYQRLGYEIERVEAFRGGEVVHMMKHLADERFMQMALRLARRALGTTAENPPVGCVIVKENQVVGVGWTREGGRPHAETEALAMAGEAARGATAYVTLEPCAHHGRTPPCAEAFVSKGINRVVAALQDPDPRTAGQGFAILKSAGIAVEIGPCADEAREITAGFLSRIEKKRPYVLLKLALSADGKIAARPGEETAITGDAARARAHLVRARSDLVLVGKGTLLGDDPHLSVRLPGLEGRSPVRALVASEGTLPPASNLATTAAAIPVWLLTTRPAYPGNDVKVIVCQATAAGQVDLANAMARLAAEGINTVLVEGGALLARSLLEAGLVDAMALFSAPKVIGPQGVDAFAGMPLDQVMAPFRETGTETLGADTLTLYVRRD
ncbi:MAG: bifunctional diaminohydroxyphosphoribosylaminopyrimidine deaminase/5-amino-6-(5-phosphoribosylamino)uracil reductase RibD [Parvibaculaceae bacterium]